MQSESNRELYNFYKSHHICVACGQRDAAPGRVRCEECLAKNAESKQKSLEAMPRERYEKIKERNRISHQELRAKRRAEGVCIECGKPLSPHSVCFCPEHLLRNRHRNKPHIDIDRNERPSYGLCYRCGAPIESGTLCEECKQTSRDNLPQKMNSGLYKRNKQLNNLIFGRFPSDAFKPP